MEKSFQTKLLEYLPDFLGLANFLRLEETTDWSKLLNFGRTCSNWPDTIGMNTKIGESTIFKAKTIMLTSGKTQTYQNYKIVLPQTWRTGHRLVQSHQQKIQRDMREHDSRIPDDESKQLFIQFELSRAKCIQNTLNRLVQSQVL